MNDKSNRPAEVSFGYNNDLAGDWLIKRADDLMCRLIENEKVGIEKHGERCQWWFDPTTMNYLKQHRNQFLQFYMGPRDHPLADNRHWSRTELFGIPVLIKHIPRMNPSSCVPLEVGEEPPMSSTVDAQTDFLLSLRAIQTNGRIIYLDDPLTSDIYL
jgi:hypothetical protein